MQVSVDSETGQTIISGMGELHLEIYVERMRREYKVHTCASAAFVADIRVAEHGWPLANASKLGSMSYQPSVWHGRLLLKAMSLSAC